MTEGLFPDAGLRVSPEVADDATFGERLRGRQAARIANGYHPLAIRNGLRLHPDAPRVQTREAAQALGDYPKCGSCVHRAGEGGHAKHYAKCWFGYVNRPMTPAELAARTPDQARSGTNRVVTYGPNHSHSAATDVLAWWPACSNFQPKEGP